jgi:uncharacterized protein YndB with AHSA1/START domain
MANSRSERQTLTSRLIAAPSQAVYRAFLDPAALGAWLVPGAMTGRVHAFDARVGGGYQMSLRYPDDEAGTPGKTTEREDRYTARFLELAPPERIVEAITFDTTDPAFAGEMTLTVTLEETSAGTNVTMHFLNIPPGIRLEDNDTGTRLSLEKLGRYVEAESARSA